MIARQQVVRAGFEEGIVLGRQGAITKTSYAFKVNLAFKL